VFCKEIKWIDTAV